VLLEAACVVWLMPQRGWAAPEDLEAISQIASLISLKGVISSVFVIGVAWVLLRLIHNFVKKIGKQFARYRLFLKKAETFFQFFIYISTAVAVFFLSFTVDKTVLTIIGGTIAVALGFALKDLFASFVAGIVIMIEQPFQVGDRVTFDGQYGDIIAIGLRSVRLRTLDDNTVTIPNNRFMNEITSSGNYGELNMQVVIDMYIGLDQDIDKARRIVHEAALSSQYVFLSKSIVVLVKQVVYENYFSVRLRLKLYVADIKYEKQLETDIHIRTMKAFAEKGIKPPAVLHRNFD
jgi:small-conductance mechanosensitive channel